MARAEKRVDDIIRAAARVSEKVDAHFVVRARRARETIREGFEMEKNVVKYVELYRELLSDF